MADFKENFGLEGDHADALGKVLRKYARALAAEAPQVSAQSVTQFYKKYATMRACSSCQEVGILKEDVAQAVKVFPQLYGAAPELCQRLWDLYVV